MNNKINECPDNCGCKVRIMQNTKDIDKMEKSVSRMIWWVIAGSGTFILYLIGVGIDFLIKHLP